MSNPEQSLPGIDISRPHSSRIYDYLLGGKDNFAADRAVAEQALAAWPAMRTAARENRAFVRRAVRYLAADAGIDQFLDIGSGLPTASNVHEVAQSVNPAARVVYADNDPVVLAHARALLTSAPAGKCAYVQADLRDPEQLLADQAARATLDLRRPVALFMVALLHFVPDEDEPRRVVKTLVDALAPGSYVVATHGSAEYNAAEAAEDVGRAYTRGGMRTAARTATEFAELVFSGLDLVPPGIAVTSRWRPEAGALLPAPSEVGANAGVGRKP